MLAYSTSRSVGCSIRENTTIFTPLVPIKLCRNLGYSFHSHQRRLGQIQLTIKFGAHYCQPTHLRWNWPLHLQAHSLSCYPNLVMIEPNAGPIQALTWVFSKFYSAAALQRYIVLQLGRSHYHWHCNITKYLWGIKVIDLSTLSRWAYSKYLTWSCAWSWFAKKRISPADKPMLPKYSLSVSPFPANTDRW